MGEIARNVERTALGSQDVSSTISGVTQAAGTTGQAANQVQQAARELAEQPEYMRNTAKPCSPT